MSDQSNNTIAVNFNQKYCDDALWVKISSEIDISPAHAKAMLDVFAENTELSKKYPALLVRAKAAQIVHYERKEAYRVAQEGLFLNRLLKTMRSMLSGFKVRSEKSVSSKLISNSSANNVTQFPVLKESGFEVISGALQKFAA